MPVAIIYPGTFDPFTNGHHDLVVRAARMFDKVVVAVAGNSIKEPFLPLNQRLELAGDILSGMPNVEVCQLDGLLVNFSRTKGISAILRGLRAVSDFEQEIQLAGMNRKLAPELETLFLTPAEKYSYLSSSLVREVARLGGDVSDFVHPRVVAALRKRIG